MSDEQILKLWKDKSWKGSFTGVKNFRALLKTDKNIDISSDKLLSILKSDSLYLKHLQPTRKFERRSYKLNYYGELIQGDLAFMFPYENHKYFLILIDCYSFKTFAKPLKSKSSSLVLQAFKALIQKFNTPITKVQTDQGTEFSLCKKYCEANQIIFSYKFGANKANFSEWIIFYTKRRLYKLLRSFNNQNWPKYLPVVVEQFNDTPQERIGYLKPNDINSIADTVKVNAAKQKNNIPLTTFTTAKQQNLNVNSYKEQTDELQKNDYVYLDFNQKLFDKSFDVQVFKNFLYILRI